MSLCTKSREKSSASTSKFSHHPPAPGGGVSFTKWWRPSRRRYQLKHLKKNKLKNPGLKGFSRTHNLCDTCAGLGLGLGRNAFAEVIGTESRSSLNFFRFFFNSALAHHFLFHTQFIHMNISYIHIPCINFYTRPSYIASECSNHWATAGFVASGARSSVVQFTCVVPILDWDV